MKALITGATGFIGQSLLSHLENAVVLSRDPAVAKKNLVRASEFFPWNLQTELPPEEAFSGVEVVFHLAGESVAKGRWTTQKKKKIMDSRVIGTRNLVSRLKSLGNSRPKTLVCASAVGFYGDTGDEITNESAPPASTFLAQVCRAWEEEALQAKAFGTHVVCVRTGIVLGKNGGALEKMLLPFKLGLGGRLGSGNQWMPWVHLEDVVGIFLHASRKKEISGPINAVAPVPVTNREFTSILASLLNKPAVMSVPKIALRFTVGEFASVLTESQRIHPQIAQNTSYEFKYPRLFEALKSILTNP